MSFGQKRQHHLSRQNWMKIVGWFDLCVFCSCGSCLITPSILRLSNLCRWDISSTRHFINALLQDPSISSTCCFISLPFHQIFTSSTCSFVKFWLHQPVISSNHYFFSLPFHQLASSTSNFINLLFHQFVVKSTHCFVNS